MLDVSPLLLEIVGRVRDVYVPTPDIVALTECIVHHPASADSILCVGLDLQIVLIEHRHVPPNESCGKLRKGRHFGLHLASPDEENQGVLS